MFTTYIADPLWSFLSNGCEEWREEILHSAFWQEEAEAIMQIPLGTQQGVDSLIWHYEKHGRYAVESGYSLARLTKDREQGSVEGFIGRDKNVWCIIWSLVVPNKIKSLMWRAICNFVPSNQVLFPKKIKKILVSSRTSPVCCVWKGSGNAATCRLEKWQCKGNLGFYRLGGRPRRMETDGV